MNDQVNPLNRDFERVNGQNVIIRNGRIERNKKRRGPDDDTGSDADNIRFGERYPGSIPASLQLLYYQVGGLPGIYKCGICNQKFLDRYCETT